MRKNKFLTFLFSMVPGCGHMYLGYMKRGAQFMVMFAASVYFVVLFSPHSVWALGAVFVIMLPVIWFYQMFDSMHTISQMRILEIEFPHDDGFFIPGFANVSNLNALNVFKKRKVIKIIASILVCAGIYVLFLNITEGIYRILYEISGGYMANIYSNIYNAIRNYVPPVVISWLLIAAGLKLLSGKNKNSNSDSNENNENSDNSDNNESRGELG